MGQESNAIVVTTGVCRGCGSVHTTTAHHRNYPEVRAEGDSPAEAAAELVNGLSRILDSAPDRWRSEPVHEAIADVRAFLARGGGQG